MAELDPDGSKGMTVVLGYDITKTYHKEGGELIETRYQNGGETARLIRNRDKRGKPMPVGAELVLRAPTSTRTIRGQRKRGQEHRERVDAGTNKTYNKKNPGRRTNKAAPKRTTRISGIKKVESIMRKREIRN